MGPHLVVLSSPLLDQDPGLVKGVEDLPVQEFISPLADQGLDIAVLPFDLLERCLNKDPTCRLRDIGDARLDLEAVLSALAEDDPRSLRCATFPPYLMLLLLGGGKFDLSISLLSKKPFGAVASERFNRGK